MDFPYHIPYPVALAIIAVIGYFAGRRSRTHAITEADKARRELRRAKVVARELEQIAEGIRKHLATHHLSVAKFKDRVSKLSSEEQEAAWQDLCVEAEQILKPTLRLAEQIALAYDEIRQQTGQLMTFSEVRTDPLTRVSNRRCLDETLESLLAMMERYSEPFSVAIIDIDHFKQVNDTYGHAAGDDVIREVAARLQGLIRTVDIVGRYGGEEFAFVLPCTGDDAVILAERLRAAVERTPIHTCEGELPISVSIGVAVYDRQDPHLAAMLGRADLALYDAKRLGRNQVQVAAATNADPAA
jgi:diguanylate cyclase (GGDEF)-like protein